MGNPYRSAHRRIRRRQGGGWVGLVPVVAAAAAAPLLRPVLFRYLDGPHIAAGTADVALRIGLVVVSVMALNLYTDLVRGPDRPVLDPHPIQPRALLSALCLRSARARLDLLLAALVVLSPVLLAGHAVAYAAGAVFITGAWAASLGVPYAVYLGAVWAARSPAMAGVLNLLRGDNAPMHAALIYAPGVVAAAIGLPMTWVMVAVEWAIEGWLLGWAWLALLPGLGVAGFWAARPLAERFYVPTTALLTEIDGMYAGVDEAEEGRRVYLEWTARGRPELLRALRQAGRSLWPYSVGAWIGGALAGIAAWSRSPEGPGWMAFIVLAGAAAVGTMPAALSRGDPPWLDRALGVRPWRVAAARAAATTLYAQGLFIPPLLAILVRRGAEALSPLLAAELLVGVSSLLTAALAVRLPDRALWLAAPIQLLLWAVALAVSAAGPAAP